MSDENQPSTHHIEPKALDKILELQEKEISLKIHELELRRQNDNNAHEYAKAALEANLKDRIAERVHFASLITYRLFFSAIVIALLCGLFCYALYLNKDQIVIELVKAIIFVGAGGLGGYALGKKKSQHENQNDS